MLQVPNQVRPPSSKVLGNSSRPCAMLARESRLPSSFCVREMISEQVTWQAFLCSWLLRLRHIGHASDRSRPTLSEISVSIPSR